jgi:hypothetical protein
MAPTVPSQAHVSSPSVTEENDTVLDDEWVGKAHDIIAQYQSDPYARSKELSKMKAQYMKVRYNKDIKISEDA